jgi:ABC-type multidrug transport system ATPase subunit
MAAVQPTSRTPPATRVRHVDPRPPPVTTVRRPVAAAGAAVRADRLSLRGPRGWVYRDVSFDVAHAGLVALEGAHGAGRTSLLLTLAGRMRPTSGSARVDGLDIPRRMRAVQRIAALGLVPGVNDLEPGLTVAEQFRERELLHLRLRPHPAVPTALEAWLETDSATLVRDLDGRRRHLLGAAMAMVGSPRVILVDDVDAGLSRAGQALLWADLAAVADRGITVIATCADAEPGQTYAGAVVRLASA